MSVENKHLLTASTYVINVVPSTRTFWHRHFTRRCKRCRTFLVYHCDSTTTKCDLKSHSNNSEWGYALAEGNIPNYVNKEIKWNECKEHIPASK